jgi:hypothetical protein
MNRVILLDLGDLMKIQSGQDVEVVTAEGEAPLFLRLEKTPAMATGKEVRTFFAEGWDNDYYHEDDGGTLLQDGNGSWLLEDGLLYDTEDMGYLVYQGRNPQDKPQTIDFSEAFGKWKASL